MNGKMILPWKDDINCSNTANTLMGQYRVHEWKIGRITYKAVWTVGCASQLIGLGDTIDEAIAACEADYISRCTEFLKLAGPGECVVNAIDLEGLLAMYQKGTRYADSDEIVQRLTAAIDAASKE